MNDLFFFFPSDAVFCVDIQPDSEDPIVASGGQDDRCYLWNLKSGKVLKKLENFKDSVVHVKFNFNGSFLAVADMAGTIYVLKTLPNIVQEPVWSFETGDITWLDWHPGANVLFAGTEDSSLWMWKIPSKDFTVWKLENFLPLRFYVKSILASFEFQKLPFS